MTQEEKTIVVVSHTSYLNSVGGLEKVILEQYLVAKEKGYNFIAIYPILRSLNVYKHDLIKKFKVWGVHINGSKATDMTDESLVAMLKNLNISKIIIHSLINVPIDSINKILANVHSDSKLFYIHDYGTICSGHNLLKNKSVYCGSNGHSLKCITCRFCISGYLAYNKYTSLFKRFSFTFIFPSEIAKCIWKKSFDFVADTKLLVLPHQKFSNAVNLYRNKNVIPRIAYVGYQSYNKGWDYFKKFVLFCRKINFKCDFYVLGSCKETIDGVKVVSVSFLKDGPNAMVDAIRKYKIDYAMLWSPWPETYSYTFFESYIGGANILTNINSGNIAFQTRLLHCGKVYDNIEELYKDVNNLRVLGNRERPTNMFINEEFITLE